jgi:hypothetical protein
LYLKISLETVRTGNKIIVLQEILGEKKSWSSHSTYWVQYWHNLKIAIWSSYCDWAEKCGSHVRQYWYTSELQCNLPDAILVGRSFHIFELNCCINSKWAILGLCHHCIQWTISWLTQSINTLVWWVQIWMPNWRTVRVR